MSNKFLVLLFLKVDCMNRVNAWAGMLSVSIFPITVFLSRPEHNELQGMVESHGERQILHQHRVTVISVEIEGLKLGRRQQQISHQTRGWFKDNSPELTLGWSSLWILLRVQRTQHQVSLLMCFTFLGELLPGALAHCFLQGPNQEVFILWVSYLQNLTLQFCKCKQSWIAV